MSLRDKPCIDGPNRFAMRSQEFDPPLLHHLFSTVYSRPHGRLFWPSGQYRLGFYVPKFCSSASISSCSLSVVSVRSINDNLSVKTRGFEKQRLHPSDRRRNDDEEKWSFPMPNHNESWFYKKRPSWPSSHSLRMRFESKGDFSINSPNTSIARALNSWPFCVLLGVRL
jgi:hypothetical protein